MPSIQKYLTSLQSVSSEDIPQRTRVVQYINNEWKKHPPLWWFGGRKAVIGFTFDEYSRLIPTMQAQIPYRQADDLCTYCDGLFLMLIQAIPSSAGLSEAQRALLTKVRTVMDKIRTLEAAIDNVFGDGDAAPGDDEERQSPTESRSVTAYDMEQILNIVSPITEQYHRNVFLTGMLHYADKIERLTLDAETLLQEYLADELKRLYAIGNAVTDDEANGLELGADLCRYVLNDSLTEILLSLTALKRAHVNFYVLETLLTAKVNVPDSLIHDLAFDDEYAGLCKEALEKAGMPGRFPALRNDPIVLHRAELIHWLVYPTELGKKPDEIQFVCTVDGKNGKIFVYQFKSDSETLSGNQRGQWLIGWSEEDNGCWSDFKQMSEVERDTPEHTIAYIRKYLH